MMEDCSIVQYYKLLWNTNVMGPAVMSFSVCVTWGVWCPDTAALVQCIADASP